MCTCLLLSIYGNNKNIGEAYVQTVMTMANSRHAKLNAFIA